MSGSKIDDVQCCTQTDPQFKTGTTDSTRSASLKIKSILSKCVSAAEHQTADRTVLQNEHGKSRNASPNNQSIKKHSQVFPQDTN